MRYHDPNNECLPGQHDFGPWGREEPVGDGTTVQARLCRICLAWEFKWNPSPPEPPAKATA